VYGDVRTHLTPRFYSVAFADLNDLGRGRRVGCASVSSSDAIICWATSHGPIPAPGASINGAALALAAERYVDRNNITLSTIYISSRGALFGTWTPPTPPWPARYASPGPNRFLQGDSEPWWGNSKADSTPDWLWSLNWDVASLEPWQREAIIAAVARPAVATNLDSQGPKPVPRACLSCHGGRYDASTGWVQGASLLPLIPADLTFSSPAIRAKTLVTHPSLDYSQNHQNSEEAIRKINETIYRSNPSPTIKQRITTLYGGTVAAPAGAPGTRANDLAVPPGWSAQPGLYRQVIAPYCGSCHFAQSGALSFGSYAGVLQAKQAIQRTVCVDFTMPHSEILFRKFWTEGGAVSLPGLLSTALGFQKCGP
jgi:cytochrome c553